MECRHALWRMELLMAVETAFSWHVGEDLLFTFTASSATSISGWTFSLVLYDAQGGTALFTKTTGFSITDASAGVFTVTLTAAETTSYKRAGFFRVWRTNSGSATVLAEGAVTVEP